MYMADRVPEAEEFRQTLHAAWDFLASYETMEPIVRFALRDGTEGAAAGLDDVPLALFHLLSREVEIPGSDSIHVQATILGDKRTFPLEISFDGLDGPLRVRLPDDSSTAFDVVPEPPAPAQDASWDAACADGSVQRSIESLVGYVRILEVGGALAPDDRRILDALIEMLAEVSKADQPPSGVVKAAVRWLGDKLDIFATEAAKWGGRGTAAVGTAGLALLVDRHLPGLRKTVHEIVSISG